MRIVWIGLLACVLAACGGTPEAAVPTSAPATPAPTAVPPTTAPTTVPTIVPTAAPKPTTSAVAAGPGLGISRAVLQSKFEGDPLNVTFADASDEKGAAVKGTSSAKGVTVLLRGTPENVHEGQVQVLFQDGTSSDAVLKHLIALLEITAPGIKNPTTWLQPHLDKALKSTTDTTIEGDRMITIIATPNPKIIILSVLPKP